MSNTGPFGHAPVSLSTSMGLSDPRLRRALQLGQMTEQKIGFGLKIDSEGRLSVDSKGLAADQGAITDIVESFNSMMDPNNSFDNSIFNDWLSNTAVGNDVDLLRTIVGIALWSAGDTSILHRLALTPKTVWTEAQTAEEVTFDASSAASTGDAAVIHTFTLDAAPQGGTRTDLHWFFSIKFVSEEMESGESLVVVPKYQFYDGNGDAIGDEVTMHDWGSTEVTSPTTVTYHWLFRCIASGAIAVSEGQESLHNNTDPTNSAGISYALGEIVYRDALILSTIPASAATVKVKFYKVYAVSNSSTTGHDFAVVTIKEQFRYALHSAAPGETGYDPLT